MNNYLSKQTNKCELDLEFIKDLIVCIEDDNLFKKIRIFELMCLAFSIKVKKSIVNLLCKLSNYIN